MNLLQSEYISVLHLLHSVPLPPSANLYDEQPNIQHGHALSLEIERRLALDLAFLAGAQDGPKAIPAICIAELSDPSRLQALVAVNKKSWNHNEAILQDRVKDLQTILASLSQQSTAEQDVFETIVAVRSNRILCRLRLAPNARNTAKESLKSALRRAMGAVKGDGAAAFTAKAREVITLLDAWTRHRILHRLADLVDAVCRLRQVEGLASLINSIPTTAMESTSRSSLLNILRKVARYREAATSLCRAARRYQAARSWEVVAVTLPNNSIFDPPTKSNAASLSHTLHRATKVSQKTHLTRVCHALNISKVEAERRFVEQRSRAWKGKVHAEVQLLAYCDSRPSLLQPRVIASSKDACYLCNALIRVHGKMHTPRSHGRLYPGWRMSHAAQSHGLAQRFDEALAHMVRDSVTKLLATQKPTRLPDPNESTVSTVAMESVTHAPSAPSRSASPEASIGQPMAALESDSSLASDAESESDSSISSQDNVQHAGETCEPARPESVRAVSPDKPPASASTESCHQTVGVSSSNGSQAEEADEESMYTAGPLEIFFEHESACTEGHKVGRRKLTVQVMTAQEAGRLSPSAVVDVEYLQQEVIRERDAGLYLGARGTVVKISILER